MIKKKNTLERKKILVMYVKKSAKFLEFFLKNKLFSIWKKNRLVDCLVAFGIGFDYGDDTMWHSNDLIKLPFKKIKI